MERLPRCSTPAKRPYLTSTCRVSVMSGKFGSLMGKANAAARVASARLKALEGGSKLCAETGRDHGHRATVAIVGGVGNELIVEGRPPGEDRQAVVDFDELFCP